MYWVGLCICKWFPSYEANTHRQNKLTQMKVNKRNNPTREWSKDLTDVFPKKTHEKMLNFTNQQGYHFTPLRMDNIKNIRYNRWWWGCGGREPSYTSGGIVNCSGCDRKKSGDFSKTNDRKHLMNIHSTTGHLQKTRKSPTLTITKIW